MKHLSIAPALVAALALCGSFAAPAARADGMPTDASSAVVHPLIAKPGLGLRLSYTLAAVTIGNPSVLSVSISGRHAADEGATIMFRPDAALALTSDELVVGEPKALTGSSATYRLLVTPQSDGLHYVNVFVQSGKRSQALAIPVQAGEAAKLKSAVKVQSSPNGERVISVPAKQ